MSTMGARMAAEDRRKLLLEAAVRAFATGGYAGTTTDQVAREAGVSQPYVVRIFGNKLELFLAVLRKACDEVLATFGRVLDDPTFDPSAEDAAERLGLSYTRLMTDGDLLRVLMHGFTAGGAVPEIGKVAREGFGGIFELLRRTGWDDETIRDFLAYGMLLTVLMSMGAVGSAAAGQSELPAPLLALVEACIPV